MSEKTEKSILNKANKLISERENTKSVNYLEEAIKRYSNPKIFNLLGWIYMHIGIKNSESGLYFKNDKKAMDNFYRAIELTDEDHHPYTNLGECLLREKKYKEATEILSKSVSIEKAIINQNNLACALFMCQHYSAAESVIQELVSQIEQMNIFSIVKKTFYTIDGIELFKIFYNNACIKIALGKMKETKQIAEFLLEYYRLHLIDSDDVDMVDIAILFYFCGDYKTTLKLNPIGKYVISYNIFALYYSSFIKSGNGKQGKAYYDKIIKELNEELDEYKCEKLSERISETKKLIDDINSFYNNPSVEFRAYPQMIQSNYYFRQ